MEQILKEILQAVRTLDNRVGGLENQVGGLTSQVGGLQLEIKGVKKDIKEIRKIQNYMWDDIKRIDKRLTSQEEQIDILSKMQI